MLGALLLAAINNLTAGSLTYAQSPQSVLGGETVGEVTTTSLVSPRRTIEAFLPAMQTDQPGEATECLKPGDIPSEEWPTLGPQRARQLYQVFGEAQPAVPRDSAPDHPKPFIIRLAAGG